MGKKRTQEKRREGKKTEKKKKRKNEKPDQLVAFPAPSQSFSKLKQSFLTVHSLGNGYQTTSLCTAPVFYPGYNDAVRASFLAYKGISIGLQSLVIICCVAFCALFVKLKERKKPLHLFGICMVLCSAVVDLLYLCIDPYWNQWLVSQAVEAVLYLPGDLFLAFDCAAYCVLVFVFVGVRSHVNELTYRALSTAAKAFLIVFFVLPFCGVFIAFMIRAVGDPADFHTAQIVFFALVVVVCVAYGFVIVFFGSLTVRDLKRVKVEKSFNSHRDKVTKRLLGQFIAAGVVLLLAIICLIVFVTAPVEGNELAFVWVILFAPQIIFFLTQLPVLYLFRPRAKDWKEATTSGGSSKKLSDYNNNNKGKTSLSSSSSHEDLSNEIVVL
jgi:hypothetical protein